MIWFGLGAQGKVTQRLQQIGLEAGVGASVQVGPALFYGRADPRLSFELFDATPFFVPGVGLAAALAVMVSEGQGDEPGWVPGGAPCPPMNRHRYGTALTLGPTLDYSMHFTRDGEAFIGISVGIAWIDVIVGESASTMCDHLVK
jgi:hypothetical protein